MNVEELWWSYGRLCHTVPGVLYPLPADVEEIERNDNIHYMYQYITGGDSAIRATQVHRVLDVGCGSGQWLRGMAWSNPHGQYVGVDIVDSRKRNVRANPKIRFLRHDILSSPIPLADGSMDMIHQQFLQLAIPTDSWKKVLTEYHRILRPGGWCEVIEGGLVLQRPGPLGQRVNAYLHLVAKAVRVDLGLDDHIPQFFPQAGLSDLRRTEIPCGIGSWAGPQGSFGVKTLLGLVEALNDRLCAMGIPQEEVEEVLEGLADEVDIWETYTIFIHPPPSKPAAQSPWDS
ncbi:MAG: S-adenosyl-L-methionine-dependent methyltransferase [Piptocephalis tieghemiana]|nr:MAG: S-adenosyl-L-methionine-dependent methyltransferase [Piptocephalis tieghemiana]